MWIFRKLALKILWNHFRWTYFWRIFAICNHCVLSWQRKVLLLFSAVSLSLWLLSLIVEQECLFSLLVLLSKVALKVSISVAISSQLFVKQLLFIKVEKILKGSLDSIPSPSPSVKIQIMGGKVCLWWKGKTLVGVVNKLLRTKSFLTSPSNVLPYHLK